MTVSRYLEFADELTASRLDVRAGKMFGMSTLKVGAKAFAGDLEGDMVFKLAGDARELALALPGAHLFDPMGGRPMKEWVVVPGTHHALWSGFADDAIAYCSA